MTRKDYVAIAAVVRTAYIPGANWDYLCGCRRVAESLAAMMAADNPAFDRARFLKACGVAS